MNLVEAWGAGGCGMRRASKAGRSISVEVEASNGPVSRNAVPNISEPFFTTKPSGMGLGLAIASNLARQPLGGLQLSVNASELVYFTLTLSSVAFWQEPSKV